MSTFIHPTENRPLTPEEEAEVCKKLPHPASIRSGMTPEQCDTLINMVIRQLFGEEKEENDVQV